MDTFSPVIDSLLENDPVKAQKQIHALMRSGNLAEKDWAAAYSTFRLAAKAVKGRGYHMYADTKKAWWGYYTAQALEELRTHIDMNEDVRPPMKTPLYYVGDDSPAIMDIFSPVIDALIKTDPVKARKQLNLLMRSGNLPQENWLTVYDVLLLINKAIDGRGDFMHADTKKAWLGFYTAQALETLRTHLGINEVVQFPVGTALEAQEAA